MDQSSDKLFEIHTHGFVHHGCLLSLLACLLATLLSFDQGYSYLKQPVSMPIFGWNPPAEWDIEHDRVVPAHGVEEMTLYIPYIVTCDYFIDKLLNLNRSCSWDQPCCWGTMPCCWDSWSCGWVRPCGWGNWSYCWDCTWDLSLREFDHKAHRCSACDIL